MSESLQRPVAMEAAQAPRRILPRSCSMRCRGVHRLTGWYRPYRSASRAAVWSSGPFHFRRHRRQDRIDIAAGLQSEDGAAIIQQVELDVTSAPDQLLFAVGGGPGRAEIAPDDFRIDLQETAADILGKGKVGVPVAAVMPVVEDAADAARFLTVRQIEIIVAPFPVFFIGCDRRMRVAGRLQ